MSRSPTHKRNLDTIQEAVILTNPYRRERADRRTEYFIYNTAFLASYLASLAEEDPFILKRFILHCEQVNRKR
jgi:hypothetical protein